MGEPEDPRRVQVHLWLRIHESWQTPNSKDRKDSLTWELPMCKVWRGRGKLATRVTFGKWFL